LAVVGFLAGGGERCLASMSSVLKRDRMQLLGEKNGPQGSSSRPEKKKSEHCGIRKKGDILIGRTAWTALSQQRREKS